MSLKISEHAKSFMHKMGIKDVTFDLIKWSGAGCCFGVVQEIEPVYEAPVDARDYQYYHVEGRHIFVSREVRVKGPLTLDTEGLWKIKRLCLKGATIPL